MDHTKLLGDHMDDADVLQRTYQFSAATATGLSSILENADFQPLEKETSHAATSLRSASRGLWVAIS